MLKIFPFCRQSNLPTSQSADKLHRFYYLLKFPDSPTSGNNFIKNGYDSDNIIVCCKHTKSQTTNYLEGWHAALNRSIRRPQPNIFVLINELKNQQYNFELDIVAQKTGNQKPLGKMKFWKLEERLTNAKDR